MSARAIGVLLALGAAAAFEVSYLLMAAQARRVSVAGRPGASFLGRLARRPWWLVAMGLNGLAFVLELVALRHVSLVVVQPLLAVGLVGLVLGARIFLGERVDTRRVAGAALVAAGVTLVVAGAPAATGAAGLRVDAGSIVAVIALLAALAFPQLARRASAWRLVAAAAAGDTLVALATNEVAAAWSHRLLIALAGVLAVAICGLMAVSSESAALQQLPASRVAPIVNGVQVTLPVLLVGLLGHQQWNSATGGGALLALGVLIVGGGAFCLGGTDPRKITGRHGQ
jgi:drug/metabolite transporter (DMT)-like permease